jgi:GDPmannose 4,6-dehydratase
VVATGVAHTVREFAEQAFARLDLDWQKYVAIDPKYFRPAEVDALRGDPSKARRELGWEPRVDFDGLVTMMIEADWELARQEKTLRRAGHRVGEKRSHE